MTVEHTILSQLLYNDEFTRRALPHISPTYFEEAADKALFNTYVAYWEKYNVAPTKEALSLELEQRDDINDETFEEALGIIEHSFKPEEEHLDWLVDTTEQWCKDRAMYNAVMASIAIIDGDDDKRTKHAIPELMKEALAVSFSTEVGHDYINDAHSRFDYYHEDLARLPFDIALLNKITNGGIPAGTLNVLLAGTNVGKTLGMVHFTASYLKQGKNVLYITLEMAEEEIARRIDANLFDVEINKVEKLNSEAFEKGILSLRTKSQGNVIIKQFPTGAGHVGHFRALLQELKLKKNFTPDVLVVDYIGICASSRVKMGSTNSYFYVKAVAEELRGLAIECQCPLWTAVQATRGGFGNADMDITDTAESFGLPATADLMLGVIRTDEFDKLGQLLIKQLKNRYGNKSFYEKFLIGVKADRQQLYDLEDSAQKALQDYKEDPDDDEEDNQKADPTAARPKFERKRGKGKNKKFNDFE